MVTLIFHLTDLKMFEGMQTDGMEGLVNLLDRSIVVNKHLLAQPLPYPQVLFYETMMLLAFVFCFDLHFKRYSVVGHRASNPFYIPASQSLI
jgi:hypothetical protein